MKILQIFGAVVAVHLLAFIFIFASPGCQSSPRNIPTPDATVPTASGETGAPVAYNPAPADTSGIAYAPATQPGRAEPTRPGSPNAVAVTPAKPAEEVAPVSTYSVGRGDSLWSIAKKNHMTVAELAKANNLAVGATLKPGQKLIIPGKVVPKDLAAAPAPSMSAATTPVAPAPTRSSDAVTHVVQSGESLGTIARRYQVTVGELAAANSITDPTKVRAGQKLVIPGFKSVPQKSTAAKTSAPKTSAPKAAAAANTPATQPAAEPTVSTAPHFEIAPPPPGQDLDAGLKDQPADVPTIKVDDAKTQTPPKG
ncbi:MAG: LysM peptidoglycan-binding domain-containing protein [Candidatus Didemnitutus sp.]|nr:LysM peptidoglycan-binding domain-containing protein [Candidatus Didemnitutus sp.]